MDTDEFIERCAADPIFFAEKVLYKNTGIVLSPKQRELVKSFEKFPHVAAIFNRQGGKTETFAIYDTHQLCFGKDKNGQPDHTFIYAPIMNQTEIIMGRVHSFFNSNPLLRNFAEDLTKYFIRMKNGNTLQALSASEQSHIRGYSPTKIQIDETQDISDRVYYDDILPSGATTGAKIQETGTPKGRNHFFQLAKSRDESVKIVYQTWRECPFADKEYILKRKTRMPRAKFQAEFECKFLTHTNVAFSTDMLDSVIHLEPTEELPEFSSYYLGGDFGKQDETVFVVLGFDGKELYQADMRRLSAFENYKVVLDELNSLAEEWRLSYGIVDSTGVGEGLSDMIPTSLPIDGNFQSNEFKQEMVDEFMVLGEGEDEKEIKPKIHLWKDYDLRQQFYEWEAKKLESGKIRYHHPKNGHDDIVIAVLNAVKAYVDDNLTLSYGGTNSVKKSSSVGGILSGNNPLKILKGKNPFR